MVLTMKLTSFAYNLHDGADDEVFKTHSDRQKNKVNHSSIHVVTT